jgi:RNA polymerase-binding transcription factor DksA
MADDADLAQKHSEQLEDIQRQQIKERASKRELYPNGYCHECEEAVPEERLFCDIDCRDIYEKRRRADIYNGK